LDKKREVKAKNDAGGEAREGGKEESAEIRRD